MSLDTPGHPNRHDAEPVRSALVTGAGRGIGHATALALAAAGFRIHAADLEPTGIEQLRKAVETAGGACRTHLCDVGDPAGAEATVAAAAEDGRIDVLVNCAGTYHVDDLLDVTFATWRRVMAVNADGTFLMGQAAARRMTRQERHGVLDRRGMIINIGSAAAEVGRPPRAAYGASKALVKHLTMTQDLALRDRGVAACLVYPGEVVEGMLAGIHAETGAAQDRPVRDVVEEARRELPRGRFQGAAEVADRLVFLASSAGMEHSGTVLWCDSHIQPL